MGRTRLTVRVKSRRGFPYRPDMPDEITTRLGREEITGVVGQPS
jgi:hypothetical protein